MEIKIKENSLKVLGSISAVILAGYLVNIWGMFFSGPDQYTIYVVGNDQDPAIREMKDEFRNECNKKVSIDGKDVRVLEEDDKGNPSTAAQISAQIARKKDTLGVVGHFYSANTKLALPNYLVQNSPIPVVLITETTPNLLPVMVDKKTHPVFRMLPTDEIQAVDIVKYALSDSASVFWVVEDIWKNTTYSHYLAEKIIEQVQKNGGQVVLWSTNISIPSAETLKALRIDSIFFPGDWSNALILIRQVNKIWEHEEKKPKIYLTDSSVYGKLLEQAENSELEAVYLTHPIEAAQFGKNGGKKLAKNACLIFLQLIQSADSEFSDIIAFPWFKKIIDYHSVEDARKVIANVMKEAMKDKTTFKGATDDETYVFGLLGIPEDSKYHLWKIRDGNFVEDDQ